MLLFFIVNASYPGSYGNSANTVVYPSTVVALSIAIMIGDGSCAFISIALGAGHKDQARRSIDNAIILSIVSSLIIMILYLTFQDQIITAVMSVWYLSHMKAISLEENSFVMDWKVVGKSLSLGITSFLSQISIVASMMVIQNMIMRYGALDPVFGQTQYAAMPMAVLGIVMKFFLIIISFSVGLSAGRIPVAGYNVGAGRRINICDRCCIDHKDNASVIR